MLSRIVLVLMLFTVIASTAQVPPSQATPITSYSIIDVGNLPGANPGQVVVTGLNNAGQLAGWAWVGSATHGFVWSNALGYTDLFDSIGAFTVQGINSAGQIIGSYVGSEGTCSLLYLNGIVTATDCYDSFIGINNSAQIAGVSYYGATLWSAGNVTQLNVCTGCTSSYVYAINDSGQITGKNYYQSTQLDSCWLYTAGAVTDVGTPANTSCIPNAINNSGQIVGNFLGSSWMGFIWSASSGLVTLTANPAAINNNGQVVGSDTSGATLWTEALGTVNLNTTINDPTWSLTEATAINDNGQIAGTGTHNGEPTIFLLTPILPAAVELTPSYLVFPSTGSSLPLTVTNSGAGPLIITGPQSFSGFNSFDFTVASSGTTCINGTTVAPGSSCTINIVFNPITTSAESATLSIFDNASNSPQTVVLSGGAPLASLTPNPVPGSRAAQVVTVTGTGFVTGATISWQDLAGGSGSVTPLSVTSSQITASMKFTNGTAPWQIQVGSPTGSLSNWFSFEVLGSQYNYVLDDYPFQNAAINPEVRDPYRFQFRECTSFVAWRMNRDAGTTNPNYPYFFNTMAGGTWGNADTWNTNALALGYTVDQTAAAGSIAQWTAGTCGGRCLGGHVAYVEQVNQDGSIVVSEYNYPENTTINHQFNVRTIATTSEVFPLNVIHVPSLKLGATLLNFGSQALSSPTSLAVTITNPTSATVPLTGITVTGVNAGDYTQTNTCERSLAPSASCQITVTFTPMGQGARSAILTVSDTTGPTIHEKITLMGSGA